MKILILGSSGILGNKLYNVLKKNLKFIIMELNQENTS